MSVNDLMVYGLSIEKNGQRIDPREFYMKVNGRYVHVRCVELACQLLKEANIPQDKPTAESLALEIQEAVDGWLSGYLLEIEEIG